MANSFVQYLKDTRGELRHVAWPTRLQTIVYAVLVAAISVGIALYLGFFDFLFTTGLRQFLSALPARAQTSVQMQQAPTPSSVNVQTTPVGPNTNTPTTLPLNGQLPSSH